MYRYKLLYKSGNKIGFELLFLILYLINYNYYDQILIKNSFIF